jgi:hypothetical protein
MRGFPLYSIVFMYFPHGHFRVGTAEWRSVLSQEKSTEARP